jgi:ABC-type phosphate transport system substrate-binding protein
MAGGSDTTTFITEALGEAYQGSATANPNKDRVVNVPPLHSIAKLSNEAAANVVANRWLANARQLWPSGALVPGDADCPVTRVYGGEGSYDANGNNNYADVGDRRFTEVAVDADNDGTPGEANVIGERVQLGWVAPNGSGSGRTFALDYTNNAPGCHDIARSSAAPSGGQRDTMDSWGFALDGIGWTYFDGNDHGVTALTQEQLNKIYSCSADNPNRTQIATWGELNGNALDTDPIRGYIVQPGSGTAQDVMNTLLGISGSATNALPLNCSDAVKATFGTVQEHDCLNVAEADKPDAICFYGYSRYRIQSRALEPDKRNGSRFGAFSFSAATTPQRPTGSTIRETAGRYDGSRIVYMVIPKGNGTVGWMPSFANVLSFIGVIPSNGIDLDNDGTAGNDPGEVVGTGSPQIGFGCDGGLSRKLVRTYGLVPFQLGPTDAGDARYGESYCRHNKFGF